jgi:glycerol-3-phosphate O-acyltransferase / dihydroxyacetone phosphate acyltransferase
VIPGGVLAVIGASDCERLGTGLIAQPFNTWTSFAYLLAGGWIVARWRRWRLDQSATVFGALVFANGLGSIAYHAAADSSGRWLHDLSLLGALGFVAGWQVGKLGPDGVGRAGRWATIAAAVVLVVMGVVLVPVPDATDAVVVVLVAIALVAFVVERVRTRARPAWSDLPFVLIAVFAVVAFLLGRTSSLACHPDAVFQWHGVWHVATAVLAVVWARAALSVRPRGEGAARAGLDHAIAVIAGVVVDGFFREVTVEGRDRIPLDRPVIIVLNHFNGLVDPVVAVHALGRLPRFIAKATLWKVTLARPFLALAGLIPVYRTEDREVDQRDASAGNTSAFAACHEVLAEGGTIAIFPEGTTSARSRLAPMKTGAARIALGAFAQGVEDLVIVPIGLAFEDRVAFRGRAFVEVGTPLVLADVLPDLLPPGGTASEDDREAVDRLTDAIERHLRACAPDYETPREEATLQMAAKVALRPDGTTTHEPDFGEVELTARRLARAPAEVRAQLEDALAAYALDLRLGGLTDAEITPGPGLLKRFRRALTVVILLIVTSPFIIFGLAVNVIPYLIVRLASRRVRVPVTKGTVRMLVGIAAFPLCWIVLSIVFADGWWAVLFFLACPVAGFAALWALELVMLNTRTLIAWRAASGERRWFAENLRVDRAELVRIVQSALEAGPAGILPQAAGPRADQPA